MNQRFAKLGGVIVSIALLGAFIVWGGNIKVITVEGDFVYEPSLKATAEKCLAQYSGHSFWVQSDKAINGVVTSCSSVFESAEVRHHFPSELIVTITQFHPILKIEMSDKNCQLLVSSSKIIPVTADRCAYYPLPLLSGKEIEKNSFVQDYATAIVLLLKTKSLTAKKIELMGDKIAPWYQVTMDDNVLVYLPSGAELSTKIATLSAAIDGLNAAKERHSVIDLRFDMVTYR